MVLLEALDGETDVILSLNGALAETLGVVRLAAALPEKAEDYYMITIIEPSHKDEALITVSINLLFFLVTRAATVYCTLAKFGPSF